MHLGCFKQNQPGVTSHFLRLNRLKLSIKLLIDDAFCFFLIDGMDVRPSIGGDAALELDGLIFKPMGEGFVETLNIGGGLSISVWFIQTRRLSFIAPLG